MPTSDDPDGSWLNDPKMVRGVLRFLISKLSPADAEELDKQLTGESVAMASDAQFAAVPDLQRRFLDYHPRDRRELRKAAADLPRHAGRPMTLDEMRRTDPDAGKSFDEMFPHAQRLKG